MGNRDFQKKKILYAEKRGEGRQKRVRLTRKM